MYDSRNFTTSRRLYDTSVDFSVCLVTTLWHVCQMIQTLGRFQFAIGTLRYYSVDSFSSLVFPSAELSSKLHSWWLSNCVQQQKTSSLWITQWFWILSVRPLHPIAKFAKHRQRPNIVGLNCFVSQSLSSKVVLSPSRRVQTVPCLSCRSNCDLLAWPWVSNDCAPRPHLTPSKSHLIQISIIFLYLFVIFGGICKI